MACIDRVASHGSSNHTHSARALTAAAPTTPPPPPPAHPTRLAVAFVVNERSGPLVRPYEAAEIGTRRKPRADGNPL